MGNPSRRVGMMRCADAPASLPRATPRRRARDLGALRRAAAKGIALVVCCLLGNAGAAGAETAVFAAAPAPAPSAAAPDAGRGLPAKRSRWVWLDTAQLENAAPPVGPGDADAGAPPLTLNLFDDARFEAIVERRSPVLSGHMLRGQLVGQPGRWTLVVRGGAVRGTVLTPNRAFVVHPAAGRHLVTEVDRSLFPPDDPDAEWRVRLPPDPVGAPPGHGAEGAPSGRRPPSRTAPQMHGAGLPPAGGGRWLPIGPAPIRHGQVENVAPDNEVAGAIHTVLAHPTNVDVLYIGAVNGGIWRTDNATARRPSWRPLTDDFPSLSIGAMAMDPGDSNTILAGIGRYSSFSLFGGDRVGLLLTKDGGDTWRHIDPPYGSLIDKNISGVVVDGDRLIASMGPWRNSVYRSLDGGATWTEGEGLPNTGAFDLAVDPTNRNRLYVTMRERGVYRSDDGGASWRNVTSHDRALNAVFTETLTDPNGLEGSNDNAEMAVARDGRLYLAVLVAGQAQYIGFTDNHGGAWTAMDLPLTRELDGEVRGLNPRFKPGGQGAIHFSIRADPTRPNIVYVGGDRQDLACNEDGNQCGNFIGASDFTGRLFRGNASIAATGGAPSPQWEHLTHSGAIEDIPGGGTASGSAPHADSREMVFDARGDIIQVDDGGIYRRTSPRDNTGDWFSLNGNLQVTEMHDVAYDPLAEVVIGGNQDTGTVQQPTAQAQVWDTVSVADGGDVAVDATNAPAYSIRYSSIQFLRLPVRGFYNRANQLIRDEYPSLQVQGVSVYELGPEFGFAQPVILNAIDPSRGVLPSRASVYETHDRFDTLTDVYPFDEDGEGSTAAYGCSSNPELLYVGGYVDVAPAVLVRTGAAGFRRTGYPGDEPRDILINPEDCDTVYVADVTEVYVSEDTGATWTRITGNLVDAPVLWRDHRNLEFLPADGPLGAVAILVAGRGGVHAMLTSQAGVWRSLNEGLPRAPAWDLDHDPADNVLVVSTLGRGAWQLRQGPTVAAPIEDLAVEVADGVTNVPLAGVFSDPLGGGLTYTARSLDDTIAAARVVGNGVTITPRAAGAVAIEVTARDANGVVAITTFTVQVGAVLQIAGPAAAAEGEAARLTLTLSRALDSAVSIDYAAHQDSHDDNPADFARAQGTVTVPAGALEATFEVAIRDDDVVEPLRETFVVSLTAPARNRDFGLGLDTSATVTVNEGVCDNTAQVRDAVLAQLSDVANCAAAADPGAIIGLDLRDRGIERLKQGEFLNLSRLDWLDLSENRLVELPSRLFRGAIQTLSLSANQLRELPRNVFALLPQLRTLHLDGNALTALPEGLFVGLQQIAVVWLHDNPGAPFPLVLELRREDAEPWRPHTPATVYAHLREGAPFPLLLRLEVEDGRVPAPEFGFRRGSPDSLPVKVHQRGDRAARARLGAFEFVHVAGEDATGLALRAGPPLLLFKARPRVVAAPRQQVLEAQGDAIVLDLDEVFADFDSAELTYAATSSDPALATVSIDGSSLTITPADGEGALTVTVTATDSDGLSATLEIQVLVEQLRGLPSWRFVPLEED